MKDFYYILGVNPKSTLLEIIEAYEKLSPKFDPVLNGHDSFYTKQFNEVREAFNVLTDPVKRKQYDEQLKALNSATIPAPLKKNIASKITPKIDITFSIILILLTGVFGSYVYRSVYQNVKRAPVISEPLVSAPPVAPLVIHHKQKRHIRNKALLVAPTNYISKTITVAAMPEENQPPVAYPAAKVTAPVTYAVSKPVVVAKPIVTSKPAVIVKPQSQAIINEERLNEAEVRANETGLVYLREYAQFGAPVIKTLQDHSKVVVLEKGNKYYRVQADDVVGYIPKWAIKQAEAENGF
ncbi:DnaJ domain-containing protein [Mucilaginibacter sp. CSA2-8R]|uniref:DnaJ domain-containing protein n=1 Tax=Mucilaginibacter sp. CSA2-8R TaxID=3141542 RepID=UPI00315D7C49